MKYLVVGIVDYPGDPDDEVNTGELEHAVNEAATDWLGGCVPEQYANDDMDSRVESKVVAAPVDAEGVGAVVVRLTGVSD